MSTKPTTSLINTNPDESLRTFMSFVCDGQQVEMSVVVKSSIDLFNYCVTSREAVLSFYGELFEEFSCHYWMAKKANAPGVGANSNLNSLDTIQRKPIEFVGRLTKCFYEVARSKHQPNASLDVIPHQATPPRERISPTKSASSLAGPASPTSQTCSSPTVAPKIIPTTTKVIPVSRRTSSCNSSNDIDQTPMSPTGQDCEIVSLENDGVQFESDTSIIDIFAELGELVKSIKSTIDDLIKKYNMKGKEQLSSNAIVTDKQTSRLREILYTWATDLLVKLTIKQQELVSQLKINEYNSKITAEPSKLLANKIELWLENPINKLLVDLLLDTHNNIPALFRQLKLLSSTQKCDWLLAYILLQVSERQELEQDFSSCMEYLISCQAPKDSVTHILAHLSDTNPKALANFPKSNILFLISLCQTSPSLLGIIAQEIPDQVDVEYLNRIVKEAFSRSANEIHQSLIDSVTHCIMAAPNSYKLFLLALDTRLNERVSEQVRLAAIRTIDSILDKIHGRAIASVSAQGMLLNNHHVHMIDNLLKQISDDPSKLIVKCPTSKLIEKSAIDIFHKMSLIFGHYFASKVILHYLNLEEDSFWYLLKPLLKRYMRLFGDDGSTLVSHTLSMDSSLRTTRYWNNIFSLTKVKMLPDLKLDLDLISQLLVDRLSAARFHLAPVAQLIRLCENSLEKISRSDEFSIGISTTHRLCMCFATCFFLLLDYENDCLPEILNNIRISMTCMRLLAEKSSVASHILCRALLERSLVYGHLFNENFNPDLVGDENEALNCAPDDSIKLSKENLKVTLGHRFRRLPNQVPEHIGSKKTYSKRNAATFTNAEEKVDRPSKISINCCLLEEVFKSCINNKIEAFANLFVQFHCPVMFDKQCWPNDDALRIINERNLAILRRFEQVPPLWDLYELIGEHRCLASCMVLVKALLASHLALWASATTNSAQDRLISTSRLIPPLAKSHLIPEAFGLAVDVFPYLTPSEVYAVISDIWQYLKDTQTTGAIISREDERNYLHRLRLFMCQHKPGSLYVRIFEKHKS